MLLPTPEIHVGVETSGQVPRHQQLHARWMPVGGVCPPSGRPAILATHAASRCISLYICPRLHRIQRWYTAALPVAAASCAWSSWREWPYTSARHSGWGRAGHHGEAGTGPRHGLRAQRQDRCAGTGAALRSQARPGRPRPRAVTWQFLGTVQTYSDGSKPAGAASQGPGGAACPRRRRRRWPSLPLLAAQEANVSCCGNINVACCRHLPCSGAAAMSIACQVAPQQSQAGAARVAPCNFRCSLLHQPT